MSSNQVCRINDYFWTRGTNGLLQLCCSKGLISSKDFTAEVFVYRHRQDLAIQNCFFRCGTKIIKLCDFVKKVCPIGETDGMKNVLRLSDSELSFKSMIEMASQRETSTSTLPYPQKIGHSCLPIPNKSVFKFAASDLKISGGSGGDNNHTHYMCQDIVMNLLKLPDFNYNFEICHSSFKKPTSVAYKQSPKVRNSKRIL